MAEDTTQTQAAKEGSKSAHVSPFNLIILGIVLWVAATILAAIANVSMQGMQASSDAREIVLVYLLFGPASILVILGMVATVAGSVRWAIYGRDGSPQGSDSETLQLLRQINDRMLLSETAKRIAYRDHDVEALRQTIRRDVRERDFDAAMVLVTEMAENYGQLQEAEQIREEINAARKAEREQRLRTDMQKLAKIVEAHDFDHAIREARKIQRLYPDLEDVQEVTVRVVAARDAYKQQLERDFLHAAEKDDVDRAMELLKVLDTYLTEEEAEPYREAARGVIGKKRDNLGVQFKMSVHDKEWMQAVRVGEQIIREFPNTKMADEVRSRLDLLRERAAGQQAAAPREPVA